MNTWYMHNIESFMENETHKVLWDFEIQTDHQISARQPDFIILKKKSPPAKNNAIKTNHIEAKIINTRQCRLSVDVDETINHIIN